jgi:hypothetical protein
MRSDTAWIPNHAPLYLLIIHVGSSDKYNHWLENQPRAYLLVFKNDEHKLCAQNLK